MRGGRLAVILVVTVWMSLGDMASVRADEGAVSLYAAGSLRSALMEVIATFEKAQGVKVEPTFGASGLLRERLAGVSGEISSPRPTWGSRARSRTQAKLDRSCCSRAIGYALWPAQTWPSHRKPSLP